MKHDTVGPKDVSSLPMAALLFGVTIIAIESSRKGICGWLQIDK